MVDPKPSLAAVNATHSVLVLVLNWNGWRDTLCCLDSLQSLDYPNYHVVVVDNASTDDSVSRIRAAYPEIEVMGSGGNLGFSGGCNVGIRHAIRERVDYVWLLNNDTTADTHALTAMVDVMREDNHVAAVGSVIYYPGGARRVQAWGGGWVSFLSGRAGHHLARVPSADLHYLTAASMMIRRAAFEQVGLLDEQSFFMYWEDSDFSRRLRDAGWHLAVAENSVVFHKEHGSTGTGNPSLAQYYNASAIRFYRRHAPFPMWPILIGTAGRFARRAFQADFRGAWAVLRGAYAGMRGSSVLSNRLH